MKTVSYEFGERFPAKADNNSSFFIDSKVQELAVIFRLLGGSCKIKSRNSQAEMTPKNNYFFEDFRKNNAGNLNFLNQVEEGLVLNDYEEYVKKNGYTNKTFYKAFLNEIAACVFDEESKRHTSAFVHLYRAYEHLSYAFPMIYAAKTDNYIGTFENLRKWMTNSESDGNVGELRFQKQFVQTLYKDLPEMSATIDINIVAPEEFKESIFNALARKVLGWSDPSKYTKFTQAPNKLSVEFVEFHSFIVTLRNRFFHYSNAGKHNIGMDEVVDSELLFSFVNKPALNYIATIFHSIVKHQM